MGVISLEQVVGIVILLAFTLLLAWVLAGDKPAL